MLNNLNSERIMYWTKITGNYKVVELLKKREEVEKEIQKLDSEALINYELEKLSEPQANGAEQSDSNCNIPLVMRSAFNEAYEKWYNTKDDAELGNWLFAKSKGITP